MGEFDSIAEIKAKFVSLVVLVIQYQFRQGTKKVVGRELGGVFYSFILSLLVLAVDFHDCFLLGEFFRGGCWCWFSGVCLDRGSGLQRQQFVFVSVNLHYFFAPKLSLLQTITRPQVLPNLCSMLQ